MTVVLVATTPDAPPSSAASTDDGLLLVGAKNGQADANAEFMFAVGEVYPIKNGKLGPLHRGTTITGDAFDVVLVALALERLVGDETDAAEAETRCELLYRSAFDSIVPGGHLLVGDQVTALGLYRQMKAIERAGFVDVDCAWRQEDFFVIGGRVPE